MLDRRPPEHRWLIERLWARSGVGIIGGTPKSFKTWLGLEMATAVATATPCLGQFAVRDPGPTVVYLAEDCTADQRDRLEALANARQRTLADLDIHVIVVPTLRLDVDDDIRRLAVTIGDIRPRLLLLDPLVRLHACDENNATDIARILSRLRTIQRHYDTAIVLVHHTRKQRGTRQHGQALRGSSDLHAWGDSNLYMTHDPHGVTLTAEHRGAPPPPPVLVRLEGQPPRLTAHPAQTSSPQPSLEDRIVQTLRLHDLPMTRTQLRSCRAVNNQRLGDALLRLHRLGAIQRSPKGWSV